MHTYKSRKYLECTRDTEIMMQATSAIYRAHISSIYLHIYKKIKSYFFIAACAYIIYLIQLLIVHIVAQIIVIMLYHKAHDMHAASYSRRVLHIYSQVPLLLAHLYYMCSFAGFDQACHTPGFPLGLKTGYVEIF